MKKKKPVFFCSFCCTTFVYFSIGTIRLRAANNMLSRLSISYAEATYFRIADNTASHISHDVKLRLIHFAIEAEHECMVSSCLINQILSLNASVSCGQASAFGISRLKVGVFVPNHRSRKDFGCGRCYLHSKLDKDFLCRM